MTEVAFHFNVPDKVHYLCRLLRKVTGTGKRALVLLPDSSLHELDSALWTFSQPDFISHATVSDAPSLRSRSAVLLATQSCDAGHHDVLINTLPDLPGGFEGFDKVLEIVGLEPDDRSQARVRWKLYAQQGYAVQQYDVAQIQKANA